MKHCDWAVFTDALGRALPDRDDDGVDALLDAMARQSRAEVASYSGDDVDPAWLQSMLGSHVDAGPFIVVTDICFIRSINPFSVELGAFAEFCDEYRETYGELVFSGCDVIVVAESGSVLAVAHHEGELRLMRVRERR